MARSKKLNSAEPTVTRLKIVHRNGKTHVEDDAGNRLWGVKQIKWEVDEQDQPICTLVMYGVTADLECTPTIKVTPIIAGKNQPNPPIRMPSRFRKKKII